MEVFLAKNKEAAIKMLAKGYTPIECSYGDVSVVDDLKLDHHGKLSHMESPALRAHDELFGKGSGKYVLSHIDHDSLLTILGLEGAKAPRDLIELVDKIDRLGRHRVDWLSTKWAEYIIASGDRLSKAMFTAMRSEGDIVDVTKDIEGVMELTKSYIQEPSQNPRLLEDYKAEFEEALSRVKEVRLLRSPSGQKVRFGIVESGRMRVGFEAWYKVADVVAVFDEKAGRVTIAAVDEDTARKVGGLLSAAEKLSQDIRDGWGGRDTIIGSPRGYKISRDEWEKTVETLNQHFQSKLARGIRMSI